VVVLLEPLYHTLWCRGVWRRSYSVEKIARFCPVADPSFTSLTQFYASETRRGVQSPLRSTFASLEAISPPRFVYGRCISSDRKERAIVVICLRAGVVVWPFTEAVEPLTPQRRPEITVTL
jgi:hypothetical protein